MNLLSLKNWLEVNDRCSGALQPVPAHLVGVVPTRDVLQGIWEHQLSPKLQKLLQKTEPYLRDGHVLRWDPAVSDSLKHWMGQGPGEQAPPEDVRRQILEGDRLMDILLEYGRADVSLWARPWVPGTVVEDHPVEFRAFGADGQVQGVSNYYPQRDLPEAFRPAAQQVQQRAKRVARYVPDFTLDFLLDQQGELRMLEGGPPHHQDPRQGGAHPCCFPPGRVEGIRLTRHPNACQR